VFFLRPFLSDHTVRTAAEQRWATLDNGALLNAAKPAAFDVFVTTDNGISRTSPTAPLLLSCWDIRIGPRQSSRQNTDVDI